MGCGRRGALCTQIPEGQQGYCLFLVRWDVQNVRVEITTPPLYQFSEMPPSNPGAGCPLGPGRTSMTYVMTSSMQSPDAFSRIPPRATCSVPGEGEVGVNMAAESRGTAHYEKKSLLVLRRAKITHMGGVGSYRHTCKELFTEIIN